MVKIIPVLSQLMPFTRHPRIRKKCLLGMRKGLKRDRWTNVRELAKLGKVSPQCMANYLKMLKCLNVVERREIYNKALGRYVYEWRLKS